MQRRTFLSAASAALGATAFPLQALLDRRAAGAVLRGPGYGALRPVRDETTGLELLQLPEGFRYVSYGWTGDPLNDDSPTPGAHDGMGVIHAEGDRVTLCRNHELSGNGAAFGLVDMAYDAKAPAGCTNLTFDAARGRFLEARCSLSGTVKNCAGGPTPWSTWLSCEETVLGPGDMDDDQTMLYEREHGWIFEVDWRKPSPAVPLKAMGRFVHEAVAVDPATGIVYETEDRHTAGFYRFLPESPGKLALGGRLQMLRVAGADDLRNGLQVGRTFDVSWVDIEDPQRAHSPGTQDTLGVFQQGRAQGGATFARLEGCWYGGGKIYFDATSGGDAKSGQIWRYDPEQEQLTLIFESPGPDVLDSPDNLCVSPRGGLVLCEDGDTSPQRLHGLTADGRLFDFAANNIHFQSGGPHGVRGDFRAMEWAGATFSPDGRWLFVNIQTPGVTFAITGPWGEGSL